jgi:hypothetical protein
MRVHVRAHARQHARKHARAFFFYLVNRGQSGYAVAPNMLNTQIMPVMIMITLQTGSIDENMAVIIRFAVDGFCKSI